MTYYMIYLGFDILDRSRFGTDPMDLCNEKSEIIVLRCAKITSAVVVHFIVAKVHSLVQIEC